MKKVYLDVCCWNRPFDDQTQTRIHLEAEAVLAIVSEVERRRWTLVSSEVVDMEIDTIRSIQRRDRVRNFIRSGVSRLNSKGGLLHARSSWRRWVSPALMPCIWQRLKVRRPMYS